MLTKTNIEPRFILPSDEGGATRAGVRCEVTTFREQPPREEPIAVSSKVSNRLRNRILSRVPASLGDSSRAREEIAGVATIIAEHFHPERIILFGSHAYGAPTGDSDIDLMVVMDTPIKPREQAVRIRQTVGASYRFPMDIVVRRPEQIALGMAERDFFILDVVEEGATLFEAGDGGVDREG